MPVTMQNIRSTLQKKGWQEHHIDRAVSLIQRAGQTKSPSVRVLDNLVYFGALIIAVIGNFLLSVAMIPVFLVFTETWLIMVIVFVGIAFGALLDIVLKEIEHIKRRHLIIPELFIPAIAIINIYIITQLSNTYAALLGIDISHNPYLASTVYVLAFSLPHYLAVWHKKAK